MSDKLTASELEEQMRPRLLKAHVRLLFEFDQGFSEILAYESDVCRLVRMLAAGGARNFSVIDQDCNVRSGFDFPEPEKQP